MSLRVVLARLGVESPGYTALDITEHVRKVVSERSSAAVSFLFIPRSVGVWSR